MRWRSGSGRGVGRCTCLQRSSYLSQMSNHLWTRIKEDWKRQPLAIIGQGASLAFAVAIATWGSVSTPVPRGVAHSVSGASAALAVMVLASSLLATACRPTFHKTVIPGFFAALVLASGCLLFFSQSASQQLVETTAYIENRYEGPLVDIAYWCVFSVFVAICAAPAINRIFTTWGEMRSSQSEQPDRERGVAPIELLLFAAAWGFCLSGLQQKILGAFVFEQPPRANPISK